jgi:hypothetical protein
MAWILTDEQQQEIELKEQQRRAAIILGQPLDPPAAPQREVELSATLGQLDPPVSPPPASVSPPPRNRSPGTSWAYGSTNAARLVAPGKPARSFGSPGNNTQTPL